MGKTTLYHPIPLHVIRGSAEYCGWKFGKIVQTHNNPELGKARYTAEIVGLPENVADCSTMVQQSILQDCFLDDIRAHWLRKSKKGVYFVDLQVDLSKGGEQ